VFGREYIRVAGSPLPIVADGVVATVGVADGRMVPVLIVDTEGRPDVDHMVKAHKHLPPGDVQTQWGRPTHLKDHVALFLRFQRPVPTDVSLVFNIIEQGILVDLMLTAGAFYLQPGRAGDRLSATMEAPRIIVEVVTEFKNKWDDLFPKTVRSHFRQLGLNRHDAKAAATQAVALMREMTAHRLTRHRTSSS